MPPQFHMRKAHLRVICSECRQLQGQLNAGTDSIVEILNRKFADPDDALHKLNKAEDERNQTIQKFVDHLKSHTYAA